MLPAGLRASPPKLTYYEVPDVKATRGGVAAKENAARKADRGMVMRNGVADKVAASGTVMARLAAMRGEAAGGAPSWKKPEPAPAPVKAAPAPVKAAPAKVSSVPASKTACLAVYACVKKSQIRAGFEMDSDKARRPSTCCHARQTAGIRMTPPPTERLNLVLWRSHCEAGIGLQRPIPHCQNLLFSVARGA